jgi:hypothetical protein
MALACEDSGMSREGSSNVSVEWSTRSAGATTRQQPNEHVGKGGTRLAAACATLGRLDYFVVLAL